MGSMNIPRNFVLVGTLFLVIGSQMGARGKHDFAPLHAHLSLLGFVLSMVFALTSRSFQELAASKLATYHF